MISTRFGLDYDNNVLKLEQRTGFPQLQKDWHPLANDISAGCTFDGSGLVLPSRPHEGDALRAA